MTRAPEPGPLLASDGYGLGDAPADGSALPWARVEQWLVDARCYWVCTTRSDGRPHAMPVWALWLDGALWFSTDPSSLKARNMERNPAIVVHLESGDEVCVLEGAVRRTQIPALPDSFVDAYDAKYAFRMDLSEPGYGFYVLAPSVALTWTEADFPATATRWKFT